MDDNHPAGRVLVLRAVDDPVKGIVEPTPNQRYRLPSLSVETRQYKSLAPDHIRVQMLYVGICGTDLHLVEQDPETGYVMTSAPALIPLEGRVIGHEGTGRVVATGANVSHVQPGDIAVFSSIIACMHCDTCRRGRFNQCENSALLGMERDGVFGTVVEVPAVLAHRVPEELTTGAHLRAMTCLEPAACALLACETATVSPGDNVVVFGAGPIGLYCAMICKRAMGAATVTVVETVPARRAIAGEWCDQCLAPDAFFAQPTTGIDVIIEASGDLTNMSRVFARLRAGGRVILLARSGTAMELGRVDHMISQAISITGCRGHLGGAIERAIALYQAGILPLAGAVTRVIHSIEELHSTLSDPQSLVNRDCKVLVTLDPDLLTESRTDSSA